MDEKFLRQRIQLLPQELQDMFYDLTFTAHASVRKIDHSYEPPTRLRVSHASRILYATSYYGGSVFEIDTYDVLYRWLKSLNSTQQTLVKIIRLDCLLDVSASNTPSRARVQGTVGATVCAMYINMHARGVRIAPSALYLSYQVNGDRLRWANNERAASAAR